MKSPKPTAGRRPAARPHSDKAKAGSAAALESVETPAEGLNARRAALALVKGALDHRGGLEEAFARKPFSELELRDRALARMMAMTLLRRLGAIDRLFDGKLHKPPPDDVRMLLRLGVAQVLYMDTPAFAAVDTTVRLAEAADDTRPFKGLINAVLRGLLRNPPATIDPEVLAPGWLFTRWSAAYGAEAARAIAAMIVEEPLTDVTARASADITALAAALTAEAVDSGSLRVAGRGDVTEWPGFVEGRWWVQDAAAAIPARLLHTGPGETALDMCAAPGGKTLQLAASGAQVTAVDRAAPRLRRLSQSLERTGLSAEMVACPIEHWDDPRRFDAVLLDAPCTATGTFRRHPDVLWGGKPGDIAKLAGVQARLLDAAVTRCAPGGRLVYCVCSLEPEEGEAQADGFTARHPDFIPWPIEPGEGGAPGAAVTAGGYLRLLPHHMSGGCDGFFAARWRRRG